MSVPSAWILRVRDARKACWERILASSPPLPNAARERRNARACSPSTVEMPAGSFSPDLGSSTASLTHTSTPPTAVESSVTALKSASMKWSTSTPVSLLMAATVHPGPPRSTALLSMSVPAG